MKRPWRIVWIAAVVMAALFAGAAWAQPPQVTICHKPGKPAQKTLTLPYPAAMSHIRAHGDTMGPCLPPPTTCGGAFDFCIDVDGIASPGRGPVSAEQVMPGDSLTGWPTVGACFEGIDWFDNDLSCTWSMGDDIHLEDPAGACATALRDGLFNQNALDQDCRVMDVDLSLFDGQQVHVDLEGGGVFNPPSTCLGPDPLLKFYDANGDLCYNDGEDIVLDGNGNGVFD